MIKSNYKIGDKIISIKPGLLNGLEGDVLFNHTEKKERQLSVILGAYGSWNLSYDEVMPAGKESALEVTKLPFETEVKPKGKAGRPAKAKEVKVKRKYTKKVK